MQGIVGVCPWGVFLMYRASRPFDWENGLTGWRMTDRTLAFVGCPRMARAATAENERLVDS